MSAIPKVLVVEDNLSDVLLIQEALNSKGIRANLQIAVDGERALHQLRAMPPIDLPQLVIVDLNLPRINGLDVLRELRTTEKFSAIPVMILTSSQSPDDRVAAEQLGVSAYITKPMELDDFVKSVGEAVRRLIVDRAAEAEAVTRVPATHRSPAAPHRRFRRFADSPADSKRAARRA